MNRTVLTTGFALAILSLTAAPLLAQPGSRGGGPPFCRSGQGHPVHGWAWCVSKGWASPAYVAYPVPVRGWDVVSWDDARFRHRQPVRYDRWMGRRDLEGILGNGVLVRLDRHSRRSGDRAQLRARWVQGGFDGFVLEIVAGSTPLAYFHDVTRNGRVDRVYMRPR